MEMAAAQSTTLPHSPNFLLLAAIHQNRQQRKEGAIRTDHSIFKGKLVKLVKGIPVEVIACEYVAKHVSIVV